MTIKLVTDSTCDLPQTLIKEYDIHIVPINIQYGTETYQEGVNLDQDTFYKKIKTGGVLPATSQPSVGQFLDVYRRLAQKANEIISIHVTAKLSGTYQSALMAKTAAADQVTVYVVDSQAGSAGLGWMLDHAARLIRQGLSSAEIISIIEANRPKITVFFAVDNLKFAQMSGRISKLSSVLASMLRIKPVIGLDNGLIEVRDRTRHHNLALERIVQLTKEQTKDQPVYAGIVHALAPDRAEALLDLAQMNLNMVDFFLKDLTLSLAVHFGPGTVGLVTYPAGVAPYPNHHQRPS